MSSVLEDYKIKDWNFNETLTNVFGSFEQLDPDIKIRLGH